MSQKNPAGSPCGRLFRDNYVLSKNIGSGNFSIVRQCRHKFSKCLYAAKIMDLNKGNNEEYQDTLNMIKGEISIIRKLKHDHVLQFVDVFFEDKRAIIVTELSEYGDLYDYSIVTPENMDEMQCRLFAIHMTSAVNFMHSSRIVHRDIKPENFLLFKGKQETNYSLKLCDFGLAEEVPLYGGLTRVCGTPSYVAPEILELKTYGLPIDVWSMGVVLYFMLCQYCPFEHGEMNTLFKMIVKTDLQFPPPRWNCISDDAKDLIRSMLAKNPKSRMSAADIMHHRWFHQKTLPQQNISQEKKKTFKSAGIVVITANILSRNHNKLMRENAILSREMLESAKSCSIKGSITHGDITECKINEEESLQ